MLFSIAANLISLALRFSRSAGEVVGAVFWTNSLPDRGLRLPNKSLTDPPAFDLSLPTEAFGPSFFETSLLEEPPNKLLSLDATCFFALGSTEIVLAISSFIFAGI